MATRREFVARVVAPLVAASGCALERRKPPQFETTLDVASLAADGNALVTPTPGFDGAPILVVREAPRRFLALSMQCTHEGCPVNPPVRGLITCPCHGSQFDLQGQVRRGPARLPLARYAAEYDARRRRLTVSVE